MVGEGAGVCAVAGLAATGETGFVPDVVFLPNIAVSLLLFRLQFAENATERIFLFLVIGGAGIVGYAIENFEHQRQ